MPFIAAAVLSGLAPSVWGTGSTGAALPLPTLPNHFKAKGTVYSDSRVGQFELWASRSEAETCVGGRRSVIDLTESGDDPAYEQGVIDVIKGDRANVAVSYQFYQDDLPDGCGVWLRGVNCSDTGYWLGGYRFDGDDFRDPEYRGEQDCPAPSTGTCDLWERYVDLLSTEFFYFKRATNHPVAYHFQERDGLLKLQFTTWSIQSNIPASAFDAPAWWNCSTWDPTSTTSTDITTTLKPLPTTTTTLTFVTSADPTTSERVV